MVPNIIDVDNVSFGYSEDRNVLEDVSFSVDEPGFICIIGPNGVGKSTLIRCINGLLKPTKGTVKIFGKDVSEYTLKELSKIVGYVPVMTESFNVMTVLDTVMVGRYTHQKFRTTSEDIAIAYKALEAMEIDDLSMRRFNELSAGQHQKVSLARGLVQEPKILILDEPTSTLDARHQIYVSAFLKKLSEKSGMTIIMVSHDLNLSSKYADKIVAMAEPGRIYSIGKPKDIVTKKMVHDVYYVDCDVIDDHGAPHVILQSVL